MKPGIVWGLVCLAAVSAAGTLRAEDAPQGAAQDTSQSAAKVCEVPNSLLTTESLLPKVTEAAKSGHPLDVLVIGTLVAVLVACALGILRHEVQTAMGLCGRTKIAELTSDLVFRVD